MLKAVSLLVCIHRVAKATHKFVAGAAPGR